MTKRITQERDNVVTQLGVAFMEQEELKTENDALRGENDLLRKEVDALRVENEDLQNQLSAATARHQDETQRWATERVEIQQAIKKSDRAVLAENHGLREELARTKAQHEEETQRFSLEKAQLRRQTLEEARVEYRKLKAENTRLRTQLEEAKLVREEDVRKEEIRKGKERESIPKAKTVQKETDLAAEETTQDEANEKIRRENEKLKVKLSKYRKRQEDQEDELRELTVNINELLRSNSTRERATREEEPKSTRRTQSSRRKHADPGDGTEPERSTRKNTTAVSNSSVQVDRVPMSIRSVRSRRSSAGAHIANDITAEVSDAESTTNLDISRHQETTQKSSTRTHKVTMRIPSTIDIEPPTMNDTYLSLMEPDLVANLRKRVEELHQSERRRRYGTEKNDTLRSILSEGGASTRHTMTEMASQRVQISEDKENQDSTEKRGDDTKQSLLSNTSRRRRSALPTEMTSAFILPDITLHGGSVPQQQSLEALASLHSVASHDTKTCTVCARAVSKASGVEISVKIPTPIPVSDRSEIAEDVDATMRPSQPPRMALASVIKQLQDELAHIQLELAAEEAKLNAHDPAQGRRKRRAIEARIIELTELHRIKADMVYALFDVLEGQKGETELTEDEVNQTLRSIALDAVEQRQTSVRRPKKVVIEDVSESDDDSFNGLGSEVSEELPWEGFSDVESVRSRHSRRRSGVF